MSGLVTPGAPRARGGALDHLVFAARDLEEGVRRVESLLGVRASPGGRHEGRGTRNALVGLGAGAYLEVIGVDTERPAPDGPRWLGVDDALEPRLATWCARPAVLEDETGAEALDRVVTAARAHGVELGPVTAGGRRRPDGSELSWMATDASRPRLGGVVPFLIDWGNSDHPSASLRSPCAIAGIAIEHPDPERVRTLLEALGLDAPVRRAARAALVATLRTPLGEVELR